MIYIYMCIYDDIENDKKMAEGNEVDVENKNTNEHETRRVVHFGMHISGHTSIPNYMSQLLVLSSTT